MSKRKYYMSQFIVGRGCEFVGNVGIYSSLNGTVAAVQKLFSDEPSVLDDLSVAHPFKTKDGTELWEIGTDQISYLIKKGSYPTLNDFDNIA